MEYLDIYDENKNNTNRTIARNGNIILKNNEFYLYVQCWIINSDNKILVTQRRMDKIHGGRWEPTGGCVVSGETSLEGIKRELLEEIGLQVSDEELSLIKTIKQVREDRSCFRDIFLIKKDIKLDELKFNDGEVINAKYIDIEEFQDMINKEEINDSLSFFIEEYKKIIK